MHGQQDRRREADRQTAHGLLIASGGAIVHVESRAVSINRSAHVRGAATDVAASNALFWSLRLAAAIVANDP